MSESFSHDLSQVIGEVASLLWKKHQAYGVDNLKKHGEFGILVRINDKVARLENLFNNPDIDKHDESIEDTYKDLIGYCLMALLLRRGRL